MYILQPVVAIGPLFSVSVGLTARDLNTFAYSDNLPARYAFEYCDKLSNVLVD